MQEPWYGKAGSDIYLEKEVQKLQPDLLGKKKEK